MDVFSSLIFGFVLFFFLEKIFYWRHCHERKCLIHTFSYLNLIGDAIHNFIDGLVIAASFIVSVPLGLSTTIAVAFHEIPQEIGDFGVLVYGGFKKTKALILNFVIALTAILGGIVGYSASTYIDNLAIFLLPLTAGGFIYIAASDLIPEIKKETEFKKSILISIIFLGGIFTMLFLKVAIS